MINATGVRAEESSARAKQPVSSPEPNLPRGSLSWRPIHDWELADVWAAIAESGTKPHEAYGKYGSSRVSCKFCILASQNDPAASLRDPDAISIYRRMCELELESGFAFQGSRWLTSLRSELLSTRPGGYLDFPYTQTEPWSVGGSARLAGAVMLAARRRAAEAWIPKHLQFTKGWPNSVPTFDESEKLANMRREICGLYGWSSPYLTAQYVKDRYQELWNIKQSKIE